MGCNVNIETGIGWVGLHCVAWMLVSTGDDGGKNRPIRWRYRPTCLLGSFNDYILDIRILTHEENQYSYVYKLLGQFFV